MSHHPNAFESGERKVIPAVLVYVRCGERVLMIHRNAKDRPEDDHAGKWNGLGGKCEKDESPLETSWREVREESGLDVPLGQFQALGTLQFPNFKAHKNEDWIVFVFTAEVAPNAVVQSGAEGELHWVRQTDLGALNLWPGDRHFIQYVMADIPFMGTIWYRGEEVVKHWVQEL
jgi:8-oxo-dGTP diphosphatase